MTSRAAGTIGMTQAVRWLNDIIGPDAPHLRVALVYGLAISLLSLATPISVQLLINSVAYTALAAPLWTLAGLLLALLVAVAALSATRVAIMAAFERRFFARVVAEITVRAVHAQNPFFADAKRGDLFNRFFDLVIVQKAVPNLVIGGFAIVLQSVVGLVLTSFYHPFFLAFNLALGLAILVIWRVWARRSIAGAVALSHAKHAAAGWLESLGGSNGFYKSSRHLAFAMDRSEGVTATYVRAHRRYFRYSFAQTLAFLLLYAIASAALLALGGRLILDNQLSIGQLVAAELILSGVFYGVSQLGYYLDQFYELVASSEELSLLFSIPQERDNAGKEGPRNGALKLQGVEVGDVRLDFTVEAGQQLVALANPDAERMLALLLKRHVRPDRGLMTIGGADLGGLDMYLLRSEVMVLDRPTIVEVSIREYLQLAEGGGGGGQTMLEAVEIVGLHDRVGRLPQGLDTQLASSGYPLSIGEVMALKLANAVLVRPKVLLLSRLYDLIPTAVLRRALDRLRGAGTTVILCTGRPEDITLDGVLRIGIEDAAHA